MNQARIPSATQFPTGDVVSQPWAPATPRSAPSQQQLTVVSGLASAAVHMIAIIMLGLLFANLQQQGELELRFSVTAAATKIPLESIDLAIDTATPEQTSDDAVRTTSMSINDPTLVLDFASNSRQHDVDVTAQVASSVDMPGDGRGDADATAEGGQFFGAAAYGDEFVYVVDMSTSMGYTSHYGQTRFRIACRELIRSINALRANQRFCVVMFCYRTRFMFDRKPKMIFATPKNKKMLQSWVGGLQLGGGTDPRLGVMTALRMKPDAIFLLSDGEFNGRGVNAHGILGDPPIERVINKHRRTKIPIHTIAFEDMLNRRRLRGIAGQTNGTHRFVGSISDQDLLLVDLRSRNLDDAFYAMQCILNGTHKVRDDVHRRKTVALVGRKLTAAPAKVRRLAYQTLVTLAGGEDLGPYEEPPTLADYKAAQKRWKEYWQAFFRRDKVEPHDGMDLPTL